MFFLMFIIGLVFKKKNKSQSDQHSSYKKHTKWSHDAWAQQQNCLIKILPPHTMRSMLEAFTSSVLIKPYFRLVIFPNKHTLLSLGSLWLFFSLIIWQFPKDKTTICKLCIQYLKYFITKGKAMETLTASGSGLVWVKFGHCSVWSRLSSERKIRPDPTSNIYLFYASNIVFLSRQKHSLLCSALWSSVQN